MSEEEEHIVHNFWETHKDNPNLHDVDSCANCENGEFDGRRAYVYCALSDMLRCVTSKCDNHKREESF